MSSSPLSLLGFIIQKWPRQMGPSPKLALRLRNGYTTIILSLRSRQWLISEQLGAFIDGIGSSKGHSEHILG